MEARYFEIPKGIEGTAITIREMRRLTRESAMSPKLVVLVRKILQRFQTDTRDTEAVADTIFLYVKKKVKYLRDPAVAEMLQPPLITLQLGTGDCDDMSMLIGAMNLAAGNRVRFVTSGVQFFRHVYPQVLLKEKDEWVTYDAAARNSFPGWETDSPLKKVWEV